MHCRDVRDQRIGPGVGRLEDRGDLVAGLYLPLPAINGSDWGQNVDAGGEPLVHHLPADALRLLSISEDRIDGNDTHSFCPSSFAPHTVAARSNAPTAW